MQQTKLNNLFNFNIVAKIVTKYMENSTTIDDDNENKDVKKG